MRKQIIQFVTGTQGQIQRLCPVATQQQRLILNTTTGQVFWDYAGVRHKVTAQIADWNQQDSDAESYIKNKPVIPSDISQLTDNTGLIPKDVTDLTDTSGNVGYLKQSVNMQDVTQDSGAYYLQLKATRLPTFIQAPSGTVYDIQGDSLTVTPTGSVKMNLSRYLAYENATIISSQWSLLYS